VDAEAVGKSVLITVGTFRSRAWVLEKMLTQGAATSPQNLVSIFI
jgi:hypothetical protein